MRVVKVILGCFAVLVLAGVLGIVVIDRVLTHFAPLVNRVLSDTKSPDGRLMATVYDSHVDVFVPRGSTAVNLRPANQPFDPQNNDDNVLVLKGTGRYVAIQWKPDRVGSNRATLEISACRGANPTRKLSAWHGIPIAYEEVPTMKEDQPQR